MTITNEQKSKQTSSSPKGEASPHKSAWQSTQPSPEPLARTCSQPSTALNYYTKNLKPTVLNNLETYNNIFPLTEFCAVALPNKPDQFENLHSTPIMPTISVAVGDVVVNILVDSGATSSFISKNMAKKLQLKICHMPFEAKIYGFGNGIFHKTSKFVNIKLFEKNFSCYVIEKLSHDIPAVPVPLQELVGSDLELAQSYPHPRLELDIILGLRAIHKLILEDP